MPNVSITASPETQHSIILYIICVVKFFANIIVLLKFNPQTNLLLICWFVNKYNVKNLCQTTINFVVFSDFWNINVSCGDKIQSEVQRREKFMLLSHALTARINNLLKERRWTVYKLSLKSGVAPSTLSNILLGKCRACNLNTLLNICRGFQITLSQMFVCAWKSRRRLKNKRNA